MENSIGRQALYRKPWKCDCRVVPADRLLWRNFAYLFQPNALYKALRKQQVLFRCASRHPALPFSESKGHGWPREACNLKVWWNPTNSRPSSWSINQRGNWQAYNTSSRWDAAARHFGYAWTCFYVRKCDHTLEPDSRISLHREFFLVLVLWRKLS